MGELINFHKKTINKEELSLYARIEYHVSTTCTNDNRYGSTCLKCGKCGRKFKNGVLV